MLLNKESVSIDKLMKRSDLVTASNSCSVDPARSSQATTEVQGIWTVRARDDRNPDVLTREEGKDIRAMWPRTLEANFPEDRRDIKWDAHCILTQLVHAYSLHKERDKSQLSISMTDAEKASHKLFKFAPSDERADTTISETSEEK